MEHILRHNFADSLNTSCALETEPTLDFFLRCQSFSTLRGALMTFMAELKNTNFSMFLNENDLPILMHVNKNFDNNMNTSMLATTIKFIKDSEKFDKPLF